MHVFVYPMEFIGVMLVRKALQVSSAHSVSWQLYIIIIKLDLTPKMQVLKTLQSNQSIYVL